MYRTNIRTKSGRKCAFCKHWNDPDNIAINPREPEIGLWEFNRDMKSECMERDCVKMATDFCLKFESKL